MTATRALLERWPQARLRFEPLGELPTPVVRLDALNRALGGSAELWEKRDDRTSPHYGGNKVRTLEVLFGDAIERGATHVYSTGAYGSNHAAATVLHAPRSGLSPGIMLYPQPPTIPAQENLAMMLSRQPSVRDLPHWSAFPYGWLSLPAEARARGERPYVMAPGGAVPLGAMGYVSAALELAGQIARGELPRPRMVVVAIGSNCTTAGLLLGFVLAADMGLGFVERGAPAPPKLVGVRVTPWPVTSPRLRVVPLAVAASRLLAERVGDDGLVTPAGRLAPHLRIDSRYVGRGYGYPTEAGREAMAAWARHTDHELESVYSGKSAAAVMDLVAGGARGPIVYWSTKSSAPMPAAKPIEGASRRMRRWLERRPLDE